jgi:hypothetical protein
MTTIEQIEHLVKELGPAMPDIDAIVQTEDPSWAIQFSDEAIIILEPADDPSKSSVSSRSHVPGRSTLVKPTPARRHHCREWRRAVFICTLDLN